MSNVYMDTGPFWEGAARGDLMVQRCPKSGKLQWYPRPGSIYTGERNTSWDKVSGVGTLYAWTMTRVAWAGHEDRVPYLCGLVELAEGVRVICRLENPASSELRIGMPMRLCWIRLGDGRPYPAFEPA